MDDLRYCPFCCGVGVPLTSRVYVGRGAAGAPRHFIRCQACEAQGPWHWSEPEARARWNQRATPCLSDAARDREEAR